METLKIAIQKKGRLNEDSVKLLKACGIEFNNGKSQLISKARNFPIEFLFLRDDDIPGYVEDKVADLGIVGLNELEEKQKDVEIVEELGFAKCRLSIAVPKDEEYTGASYLNGKMIATSYPVLLQNWLNENNITAEIHEISGSVEIAPAIGLTEAICDLVSTGSTLISNGLKEVEKIFFSEAVLIGNRSLSDEKKAILERLLTRIRAVQRAKKSKYILLNAPNENIDEIIRILPGMKSPTVLPLADGNWSSVHSVVNEDDFWDIIDRLTDAGAQGILVSPIEKIIL